MVKQIWGDNINPMNVNSRGANEKVVDLLQHEQVNNAASLLSEGFVCPYRMNAQQFKAITRVLDPIVVRYPQPGDREKLSDASHPVAAALNAFAYSKCQEVAKKYKRVIDIGGTPLRTLKNHHLCTLVDDCRTDARYMRASFNQRGAYYNKLVDMRGYINKSDAFCINGAQNCNYQADYAYCINAAYDIDIELWPEIFANHNLTVVDLWLFMPPQLIDDNYTADTDIYNLKIDGDVVTVDYLDHCNCYTHSKRKWMKYFETTVIKCVNFSLVFEMDNTYGTFTNIKITRTNRREGRISRNIKISQIVDNAIVPDIYHYITNNGMCKNIFDKKFSVPLVFLNRLTNWATGQLDDAFKYNQFALFAFSIVNQVQYRSGASVEMVYEGMEVNGDDFERIKISAFVIIAIMRYKRSLAVSEAFKKLKNNQYVPGQLFNNFVIYLKQSLGEITHDMKDALTSWLSDNNKEIWIKKSFIYNASFLYPRDVMYSKVIYSDCAHIFDDYAITSAYYQPLNEITDSILSKNETDKTKDDGDGKKNITSSTTNATPSTTVAKNVSPVCKIEVLYDPPGDGRCGEHALRWIYKKEYGQENIDLKNIVSPFGGPINQPPPNWYSAEDIMNIAYSNKLNVVVHARGVPVINTVEYTGRIYSIDCTDSHYRVVDCSCNYTRHVRCKFEDLPLEVDQLYINETTEKLESKTGHAKAFEERFRGYAAAFKIPVNIAELKQVTYADENGKMPIHLGVVVPYSNHGVKSYKNTTERYHAIFKIIDEYVRRHQLTVVLPKIGTGMSRCDMCCFKNALSQYKFQRIILHQDENSQKIYERTGPCQHGGYKIYNQNARIIINDTNNVDDKHSTLPLNYHIDDKMRNKIDDLIKYMRENIKDFVAIHELSAAPGDFARYAPTQIPYLTSVYVGSGALKWRQKFPADAHYNDINQHIKEIIDNKTKLIFNTKIIYLYDFFPSLDVLKSLCNLVNKGAHVITKISSYGDDDLKTKFNTVYNMHNVTSTLIQNDYSDIRSSEIYVHLQNKFVKNMSLDEYVKVSSTIKDEVITTAELQNKQYDKAKDIIDKHVCKCDTAKYYEDAEDKMNCDITWVLHSPGDYFKKFIENEGNIEFKQVKIEAVNGAAGSRKTQTLMNNKNCCPKCTLIIAPFAAISKSNNDQVEGISSTFVTALENLKKNTYKTIIIDEALAMSGYHIALIKHLAKGARVLGATDSYQITYRNYHSTVENFSIDYHPGKHYINITHRVPQPICDIFKDYVKLESKASNKGNVKYQKLEKFKPFSDINHIFLTFTQDMCNRFKNEYPEARLNINTVNASQGGTYDFVHLYYPDYIQLKEHQFSYIYTAISRCRTELILYSDDGKTITLPVLNTPIHRAIDSNVLPLHSTAVVAEKDILPKPQHANLVSVKAVATTQELVEEVMNRNLPTTNEPYSACIGYFSRKIPQNIAGHKCRFALDYMKEKITINGRMIGKRPYQLIYTPKNTTQTMHCLLTRYAKEDKHLPPTFVDRYKRGFEKWLKPDYNIIIKDAVTVEKLYPAVVTYIKNLQKKYANVKDDLLDLCSIKLDKSDITLLKNTKSGKLLNVKNKNYEEDMRFKSIVHRLIESILYGEVNNKIKDLELEWNDTYHKLVQFHLKRQPKLVAEPGYDTKEKAGQGVSAWSKMLNIIFSGFIRCVAEVIPKILLPNVQLAYGKSDRDISLFFQRFAEVIENNNFKKLVADFGEFDSSQEMQGILAGAMFMRLCNVPTHIIEMYLSQRQHWVMVACDKWDGNGVMRAILEGAWKQHSGQPDTLNGNTTFNMMAMGACYKYVETQFASFKGDDSIIAARKINQDYDGQIAIRELAGFKIKEDYANIPEYIANIILPNGTFFPDVIRRASRVLSKVYSDKADWKEQKQSLLDCLDVVIDDRHYQYGLSIAEQYYKEHNVAVTKDEISAIFVWLSEMTKLDNIDDLAPIKDHYVFNF